MAAFATIVAPELVLLAIPAMIWTKGISMIHAKRAVDRISRSNCDKLADQWSRNRKPGERGVTVKSTKWNDALISLPQTRIHHYED